MSDGVALQHGHHVGARPRIAVQAHRVGDELGHTVELVRIQRGDVTVIECPDLALRHLPLGGG